MKFPLPSRSMGVALAALALATSGTAMAAKVIITSPDQLGAGVVTEPKLADGAVSTRAILDRNVRLADMQFPVVAAGVNKGLGLDGQPFLINPTTDVAGVSKAGGSPKSGTFVVSFATPVRHCQWAATPAEILNQESGRGVIITVRPSQFDEHDVFVFTQRLETVGTNKGQLLSEPHSFYLVGRC